MCNIQGQIHPDRVAKRHGYILVSKSAVGGQKFWRKCNFVKSNLFWEDLHAQLFVKKYRMRASQWENNVNTFFNTIVSIS